MGRAGVGSGRGGAGRGGAGEARGEVVRRGVRLTYEFKTFVEPRDQHNATMRELWRELITPSHQPDLLARAGHERDRLEVDTRVRAEEDEADRAVRILGLHVEHDDLFRHWWAARH